MKNLFFGLLAIAFISLSSFTTKNSKGLLLRNCTYNMYNAAGDYLGQQSIIVNDETSCGSSVAKGIAIDAFNN